MRIFVAGGSGTIGVPQVRALVAAGHQVTALTRSPEKQAAFRGLGAMAAGADALDGGALMRVVEAARQDSAIAALRIVRNPDKSRYIDRQLALRPM